MFDFISDVGFWLVCNCSMQEQSRPNAAARHFSLCSLSPNGLSHSEYDRSIHSPKKDILKSPLLKG